MYCSSGGTDKSLLLDGLAGVPVVDAQARLDEFPERLNAASISTKELMASAKWHNAATIRRQHCNTDADLDKGVWDATIKERDNGWLQGPDTIAQLKHMLGLLFVISRRFGVKQGDKYRPIDDLSESWSTLHTDVPIRFIWEVLTRCVS